MTMTTEIRENILAFQKHVLHDANHRYRSWIHCYAHFRNHCSFVSEEDIDLASLHLGFYLASWGMYRGSTFLLWKDYRIHRDVVRELLKEQYLGLWDMELPVLPDDSSQIDLIFALSRSLSDTYKAIVKEVNGERKQISVTDTLLTKILLGTMGCTPAYDNYFKKGVRHLGIPCGTFGKKHFLTILEFHKRNEREFRKLQTEISDAYVQYPIMKLIDMYFWNIGRRVNEDKQVVCTTSTEHLGVVGSTAKPQEDGPGWRMATGRGPEDKSVKQVVWEVVQGLTKRDSHHIFSPADVIHLVLKKYPTFNERTVRCQIISDCVNHTSRRHYSNRIDRYWRVERGRFRLYDSAVDNLHSS